MRLFAFFELKQLRPVRWAAVLVLIGAGCGLLSLCLGDIRFLEAACEASGVASARWIGDLRVYLGLLLVGFGGAVGCYGLLLQSGRFYSWRTRKARRRDAVGPDYGLDVFMLAQVLAAGISWAIGMIWPRACGLMTVMVTMVCGLAFCFIPFYKKYAPK